MTIVFRSPIKRHYTLAEVQQQMAQDIESARSTNVSEFLRKQSTGASFGNIDSSDLKPPQLKLLAGQSPEVTDGIPDARPGNLWLTIPEISEVWDSKRLVTPTSATQDPIRFGRLKCLGLIEKGPLAVCKRWWCELGTCPNQSFDIKFPGLAIRGPTHGS